MRLSAKLEIHAVERSLKLSQQCTKLYLLALKHCLERFASYLIPLTSDLLKGNTNISPAMLCSKHEL